MTESTMRRVALFFGSFFLVLALVILIFADGLRRWYSGIFFALIGTVTLLNTLRWRRTSKE